MIHIRRFIAGLALPSVILPFLFFIAFRLQKFELMKIPFLHFIPLLWGLWNMLYCFCCGDAPLKYRTPRLLFAGAILGLIIASIGVFALHLPQLLGVPSNLTNLPLAIGIIVYAILWRYVVDPLNKLLRAYK